MTAALGKHQIAVLTIMHQHQPRSTYDHWHEDAGWTWGTVFETDRILRSLARRGLVRLVRVRSSGYGEYEIVEGTS